MRLSDKFEEFLIYSKQQGLKEQTIKDYKRHLFGSLSHCLVKDKRVGGLKLTDTVLIVEAGREHGRYGAQKSIIIYRQYLKFLKESGIKLPFDYRDIKVPRVAERIQPVLNKKELTEILGSIDVKTMMGLRLRTLLEVLFATGARINEILQLNKDSIDWDKKEAKTIEKGGDEAIVYFTDRSLYWIKRYLRIRNDEHLALFVNKSGTTRLKQVTSRATLLQFQRRNPRLKHLNHHIFRRTLATYLIEHGADIKSTQTIMRHKSPRTTLKYYVAINMRRSQVVHKKILSKF